MNHSAIDAMAQLMPYRNQRHSAHGVIV